MYEINIIFKKPLELTFSHDIIGLGLILDSKNIDKNFQVYFLISMLLQVFTVHLLY